MDNIKYTTIEYPFNEYFIASNISNKTKTKLNTSDIVILPNKYSTNNFYFSQETFCFLEHCNKHFPDKKVDTLSDDNNLNVIELRASSIWMPIIWIASEILLPVAINLVSSYLKDRRNKDDNVIFSLMIKEGTQTKELKYDGPAKEFNNIFEKIDISKL